MTIALIGNTPINTVLTDKFMAAQMEPMIVAPQALKSVSGQIGDFRLRTKDGEQRADVIVVTDPVTPESPAIGSGLLANNAADVSPKHPVVILMDHEQESPQFMTRAALEKALVLASRLCTVFFLKRSVKTAGTGLERLYQQARGAGVVFVDYDRVEVAEAEAGFARVWAAEGVQSFAVDPCSLLVAEALSPGETASVAERLRLQTDRFGFIDEYKHYLYPVLTSRRGVYVLDSLRAVFDLDYLSEAVEAVMGDAAERLAAEANPLYAELEKEKCAFCYTCFRACPHAALAPNQAEGVMEPLEEACFGCGICVSMCPANALALTLEESVESPSQSVRVFCCENSGDIAMDLLTKELEEQGLTVSRLSVSCGGDISVERLLRALQQHERVIAAVCMDDACQHFDGTHRACAQVERAVGMLEAAGLEPGRIRFVQLSQGMPRVLQDEIREALV